MASNISDEAEFKPSEQNASDDGEDDDSYDQDDFESDDDDDNDDDDDDDDNDDREISTLGRDGEVVKRAQAENEKLLSRITDLENEVAVAESKMTETVIKEKEGLQSEITELQIKLEEAKVELEDLKKLKQARGWLWKRGVRGPTGKNWRRRWFKAQSDGSLHYYKRKKILKGSIQIDQITEVEDLPSSEQNEENSCFNVVTPGRTYEIKAKDKDDKLRWISHLDHLMKLWPNRLASVNEGQTSVNEGQVSGNKGQASSVVCTLL